MIYIGENIKKRMDLLGLSASDIAEKTFLDEKTVIDIIENKISLEDIDDFDISVICNVLHCDESFLKDENYCDFLSLSINKNVDNKTTIKVKSKIQDFINDFSFISGVLAECN